MSCHIERSPYALLNTRNSRTFNALPRYRIFRYCGGIFAKIKDNLSYKRYGFGSQGLYEIFKIVQCNHIFVREVDLANAATVFARSHFVDFCRILLNFYHTQSGRIFPCHAHGLNTSVDQAKVIFPVYNTNIFYSKRYRCRGPPLLKS